ncbi:MAG: endolytic transglycosylase MltG [Nitrospirae bacterium]|nr:endolytic transglycosylase MltG [Nitrospirota bacterium]
MKPNLKIIAVATSFLVAAYIGIQLFVPANIGSTQVEVEIPEGSSYKQALSILAKNNLIRDRNMFVVLGKITGLQKKIRAGYYVFWGNMSPLQVFKRLSSGKIIEYEITVVEGDSLLEISKKLTLNKIMPLENFKTFATDRGFLDSLNIAGPSLEGYLYPQTYKFPKGAKPAAVLKLMVNKLREEFNSELQDMAKKIGWSENQVLALASIIEREAKTDEERPVISAVYHNRLKKGMPLQADPTAIYGIKSNKRKITKDDLRKKTFYNTYVIKGLPPGPIASPSIKSIKAALYPANVPYLYFVSKNDGTHYFSKTLSEHNAAVKRLRALQAASLKNNDELSANTVSEDKEG